MRRAPTAAATVLALATGLLASCGGTAETGILLRIVASDGLAGEVKAVRVRLRSGPPGAPRSQEKDRLIGVVEWPVAVAIRPEDGDASRLFEVTVEGFASADDATTGAAPLVRARVESGFLPGAWRVLTVWLRDACRGQLCAEGQSCGLAGRCIDTPFRDPRDLPPLDSTSRVVDGGASDGGTDASRDGGSDGGGRDGATTDGGSPDGGRRACPPPVGEPRPVASRCRLQWFRTFGGADPMGSSAADAVLDVALSPDGSTAVAAGRFRGTADFGGGRRSTDLRRTSGYLAAFDASGCWQWDQVVDPSQPEEGSQAAVTGVTFVGATLLATGWLQGQASVGAQFLGDASGQDVEGFVLALGPGGAPSGAWRLRGASDGSDEVKPAGVMRSGEGAVLWGRYAGSVDLGTGETADDAMSAPAAFALVLRDDGAPLARHVLRLAATGGALSAQRIAPDSMDVTLLARFEGWANFGGTGRVDSDGADTLVYPTRTSSQRVLLTGNGTQAPAPENGGVLDSVGGNFYLVFHNRGDLDYGAPPDLGSHVTNSLMDSVDAVVLSITGAGHTLRWSQTLASGGPETARVLRVANGQVWVGGSFGGDGLVSGALSPEGGPDAFVVALNAANGEVERFLPLASTGTAEVTALAVRSDGSGDTTLLVGGAFSGSDLRMGSTELARGTGEPTPFLARFDCR